MQTLTGNDLLKTLQLKNIKMLTKKKTNNYVGQNDGFKKKININNNVGFE